jgi:hypothetical protein
MITFNDNRVTSDTVADDFAQKISERICIRSGTFVTDSRPSGSSGANDLY